MNHMHAKKADRIYLPYQEDGKGLMSIDKEHKATMVGLDNYLTETIRSVVRREVEGPKRRGKVYKRPRIYNHLLSSQPLCFNLFGELAEDRALASLVLGDMSKGRVSRVTTIEFEWSPGRGDPRYTGDKSAFDVYVTYETAMGQCGFLAIEAKYHENLEKKTRTPIALATMRSLLRWAVSTRSTWTRCGKSAGGESTLSSSCGGTIC